MDDRGNELARLIDENPDDVEAYRAFGDWLEEQGDPRNQLMGMHIIRERITDRTKLDHLDSRLETFFEQHRERLLGPFSKLVPKPTDSRQKREGAQKLTWRYGFIHSAKLHRATRPTLDKIITALLTSPSGRFVVDLEITWPEDGQAALAAMIAHAPLSLRKLDMGTSETDFSTLWPAVPRLRELVITSAERFGAIDLPELRVAEIATYAARTLHEVRDARWPKLETLRLRVGGHVTIDEYVAALAGLPNSVHAFAFEHPFQNDAAVMRAFVETPFARQIRDLEVSSISSDEIDALSALTLDVIRVPSYTQPDERARLARIAKRVEDR